MPILSSWHCEGILEKITHEWETHVVVVPKADGSVHLSGYQFTQLPFGIAVELLQSLWNSRSAFSPCTMHVQVLGQTPLQNWKVQVTLGLGSLLDWCHPHDFCDLNSELRTLNCWSVFSY